MCFSASNAQILTKTFQLFHKTHIGVNAWPSSHNNPQTGLITFLLLVYDIGYKKSSWARHPSSAVNEHVAFLPLLLDEPKNRKEGVANLFLLVVSEVELVVGDGWRETDA